MDSAFADDNEDAEVDEVMGSILSEIAVDRATTIQYAPSARVAAPAAAAAAVSDEDAELERRLQQLLRS
jgi:division protein CdvB (Snf7/Vps24/ESCRT-III family)